MLLFALACGGGNVGIAPEDREPLGDTGQVEDTGPAVPLDGMGTITGDCGELDHDEWTSGDSFRFRNAIELDGWNPDELSDDGTRMWEDENLGGSSKESEVISLEVLYRCELASLLKTEPEIDYATEGKKTDWLGEIDARRVGVSVTRAFHWPPEDPYTVEEADDLLREKFADATEAHGNAANPWDRTILHVIAYDSQYADMVEEAHDALGAGATSDHILVVTVSDGDDEELY
ncbi:MAG: hypothetical protein GY913_02995 [Proteobacteria bacterium]|nr:hypothetical protein [Pseudomonadota bacterium]MCP4915866.1 hypothetical protein [Pseudomonadota bacterium]